MSTSEGTWTKIGVAAGVVGAIGAIIAIWPHGSNGDEQLRGADISSSSAPKGPFDSTDQGLPKVLIGSWGGTIASPSAGLEYRMILDLEPSPGSKVGQVEIPKFSCKGFLTFQSATSRTLSIVVHMTEGASKAVGILPGCIPQTTITLRYLSKNKMYLTNDLGSGNLDEGTVKRVSD